jgi:hypothetical protein
MLAAPLPADAVYLILPTIVSFLICTLVVSVSVFFVSIGDATWTAVVPEGLDDITLHGVDREVRAQLKGITYLTPSRRPASITRRGGEDGKSAGAAKRQA